MYFLTEVRWLVLRTKGRSWLERILTSGGVDTDCQPRWHPGTGWQPQRLSCRLNTSSRCWWGGRGRGWHKAIRGRSNSGTNLSVKTERTNRWGKSCRSWQATPGPATRYSWYRLLSTILVSKSWSTILVSGVSVFRDQNDNLNDYLILRPSGNSHQNFLANYFLPA